MLLAEDEPDIQMITRMALEDGGCSVVAVGDGQAVLEQVRNQNFDVILLDVMMPRIDGFTACARLHADPQTRDLPVIFLTAKSQELEVQRGLEMGARGYIVKPFDVFCLVDRINAILGKQSA
ncbi:two-component response regulator [Oscillochloris trichoides DG-6]|uniref:Two-component response regulator n=1 Tax=Oscillochloris trichoides DG-6 TaxID=765420 RepID=E1ICR7_9CHLR|nr:two-component response regulator [Oscillochloris trichoides DG-6]